MPPNASKYVSYLLYGNRAEYRRELAISVLSALRFLHEDARGVRLCVFRISRSVTGHDLA